MGISDALQTPLEEIDASVRDASGAYYQHVVETLPRKDSLNVAHLLAAAA